VVISFLHIVVVELAPKSMAIQRPLQTSLWVAEPLFWFYQITYPAIWLLNHTSLWLLRQVGLQAAGESELHHSAEELRLIITTSEKRAGDVKMGRSIVLNAMDLRHRVARDVMRPRKEIVVLDYRGQPAECLEVAEKTRYSRFPLCVAGDVDRTLGWFISRISQHIVAWPERRRSRVGHAQADLRSGNGAPGTVAGTILQRKLHLAIVIDEYGGTVGLVTLEISLKNWSGRFRTIRSGKAAHVENRRQQLGHPTALFHCINWRSLTGEKLEGEGTQPTTSAGHTSFERISKVR